MKEYDRDTFWNIDKLVPKTKTPLKTFSTKPKIVDYAVDGDNDASCDAERRLKFDGEENDAQRETFEYTVDSGLVRNVRVTRLVEKFDFHSNFVKAARLYFEFKGAPCEFEKYYSYMPQYSQLTLPQKNYYFYWRTKFRDGEYLKTDYSYFYLYVYEVLNLPDLIGVEEGLEILLTLWEQYRTSLPNVDANMSVWVQDYCFVHRISLPYERIRNFAFSVISSAQFKEFFISSPDKLGTDGVCSTIAYLSDYDWRSGKYAGGDNKEVYSSHMLGAMSIVINRLFSDGKILSQDGDLATLDRIAFKNALTTSCIKYRISVDYLPISSNLSLRNTVTSALKYTENKMRSLMSVKSRLAVKGLDDEYKKLIDGYFETLFQKVNSERARASRPEYEKLYETDNSEIRGEDADMIEKASWGVTARLVENSKEYDETEEVPVETHDEPNHTVNCENTRCYARFLQCVLDADVKGYKAAAEDAGELTDTLAERVNEIFLDELGDVVIEVFDGGYAILEDYREDVKEWIEKTMR